MYNVHYVIDFKGYFTYGRHSYTVKKHSKIGQVDMTPFGRYLSQLRRERGLQQQRLADEIGVNSGYLSNLENGRKGPPSDSILARIGIVLRLTEDEKNKLTTKAKQSQQSFKIPGQVGEHEYILVEQLWQRLGTISVEEAEILSKVLQLTKFRGVEMKRE